MGLWGGLRAGLRGFAEGRKSCGLGGLRRRLKVFGGLRGGLRGALRGA